MNGASRNRTPFLTRIVYLAEDDPYDASIYTSDATRAEFPGSILVICTNKNSRASEDPNRKPRVFVVPSTATVGELKERVRELEQKEWGDKNPAWADIMKAIGRWGVLSDTDLLRVLDEHYRDRRDGYLRIEFKDSIQEAAEIPARTAR